MVEDMVVMGSKLWVINFYREQLNKFDKLGLGKITEHNVRITPQLVEVTKKRLNELSANYNEKLTPDAFKFRNRRYRIKQAIRNKENGQLNSNGAAPTKGGKDISTDGHEGSGS